MRKKILVILMLLHSVISYFLPPAGLAFDNMDLRLTRIYEPIWQVAVRIFLFPINLFFLEISSATEKVVLKYYLLFTVFNSVSAVLLYKWIFGLVCRFAQRKRSAPFYAP